MKKVFFRGKKVNNAVDIASTTYKIFL